ncbi:MAG: hypothetical protein ACRDL3_00705 [Solirubrobacterales bacterium]
MEGRPPQQPPSPGPTPPPKPPGPGKPQTPGTPAAGHSVDPHERIDGLRSWIAQVERKLGVRTYIGAALAVLALAAGGAGVFLALRAEEDAATEADVENLREELTGVEQTAAEAAQQDVEAINETVADLEDQISRLRSEQRSQTDELSVAEDDIQDLRDQISELETGGADTAGP